MHSDLWICAARVLPDSAMGRFLYYFLLLCFQDSSYDHCKQGLALGGDRTNNKVKIFPPCPCLWLAATMGSGCGISPGLTASPLLEQVPQAGSRDSRRRRSACPEQLPSGTEGECNVLMGGCDKRPSSPGLRVLPHEGLTDPGQFSVEWKNLNL